MDSRYSSGSHRQPDHRLLQPSSSLGYIPQPVIREGYEYTTDRMYPMYPITSYQDQDPLLDRSHSVEAIHHEAMQRQLEKQQIREEIIRAENKRRQMLEEEVRRELMMERQMLKQHHGSYATEERPFDGHTSDYRPLELVDDRIPFVDRFDSRANKDPWAISDSCAKKRPFDGHTSDYRQLESVDDRIPFVDRFDSRANKDPWAISDSSADKFSFVDRVDGQASKEPWAYSGLGAERSGLVNRSDFNRPVASEEQRKVPNQSSRNEIPSYDPTQPYYPESMIPKVNSALRESQAYSNYIRPEVILVPNDPRMPPEVYLANKDLMPYMQPEVIPGPTSSDPYKQPHLFSISAPYVPGPYSKAMQVQMNSAANEIIQDVSNKYASGMKRKATLQPKRRSSNNIYKLKKPGGVGWSCTLCQVSVTCEKTLDCHFNGRKHKENEERHLAEKKAKIEVEKGKAVAKEESLNRTKPQVNSEDRKVFKFWCKLCKVGADTKEIMEAHNKGKKHILNLQEKDGAGKA